MLDLNLSTILLQMANFFILAFILYRFLFKPLQNVLSKRAKETTRAMDEASIAKTEAEEVHRQYEEKVNNIDAEIAARKNEARIVIEQTRQQMLQEVQSQVEQLEQQTEETLARLQSDAVQQHKLKLGTLASEFARGILSDVMTPELEKAYQHKFLDIISQMDLLTYLERTPSGEKAFIRVILAQKPSEAFQDQLSAVIREKLSQDVHLTFETDPELMAGGIIRFENELIDGSLQGQVNHFQKRYQEIA